MQINDLDQPPQIYTVNRLNNEVRNLLEDTFPLVWVEGEISNFAAPHSGHWYFSLKDACAQVRCAMFRGSQRQLGFLPKDGLHVLIKARVSLYPNRGEYQLIAEFMEERGEGKLRLAYEALKKKLEAKGLFDVAHKKPLPLFPKQIGVITSATGAAIRDILTVLKRRFPCVPVIIYATLVQGQTAAPAIVKAINTANVRNECDVLILARGGGSLEDLWSFNEEMVADAIYQSHLPIISGIGHEVDFTIADFVADQRAPTPSAAAEIATPDQTELLAILTRYKQQILKKMQNKIVAFKQNLIWQHKHLTQQHPKRRLTEKMQRLDFCESTLIQTQTRIINQLQIKLKSAETKFYHYIPIHQIRQLQTKIHYISQKISLLTTSQLHKNKILLANHAAKLDALSPLGTLQRGYAIATKDHYILRDAKEVIQGDKIHIRLKQGTLECQVEKVV